MFSFVRIPSPLIYRINAMLNNSINQSQISIVPIMLNHLKKYPLMSVQDIYKLIYQAAMGPEHLIKDKDSSFDKLYFELEQIGSSSSQVLLEEIDPAGLLVRFNLFPFKENNGDPQKLFEAFFQTALEFKPVPGNMNHYCDEVIHLVEKNIIIIDTIELKSFFQLKESHDFPAVHHSDIYRNAYRPAYRLILKELINLI